jgi:nucleoside phosphorylase
VADLISNVDVLVLTALPMEYQAAKAAMSANDGNGEGVRHWRRSNGGDTVSHELGTYYSDNRPRLRIALARPNRMGRSPMAHLATALVRDLKPYCLAMTGVCAGNPADVALGDVVIANMTYDYDEGKQTPEIFQPDYHQHCISARWLHAAQELSAEGLPSHGHASKEDAQHWLLECLCNGRNPSTDPARTAYFPDRSWKSHIMELETEGLVIRRGTALDVTDRGRARAEEHRFFNLNAPEQLPFSIRIGPMASGSVVAKSGASWTALQRQGVRSVIALEMEAAAIGEVAHNERVQEWVVVKGVMDHADPKKDDRYKPFAARASAEVLKCLLLTQMPPVAVPEQTEKQPFDDATPDPLHCLGRDEELASIKEYFFPTGAANPEAAHAAPPPPESRRVLIQAGPGFGKTTLAAHFARAHRDYFCGVWWIPSQDPTTVLAEVTAIARPGDEIGSQTPEQASDLLTRYFRGTSKPFLLVFDNVGARSEGAGTLGIAAGAGWAPQGTEKLVVHLASRLGTNVRVLMTSRRFGWDDRAKLIELGALDREAAARLLRRRANRQDDVEGSLRLAEDLGGLPLALDHAGVYCKQAQCSFDEYRKDFLVLLKKAPENVEYDTAVFATTTKGLELARKTCEDPEAVTRLADFLSYCSADRIPRELCLRALDGNSLRTNAAIVALRNEGLLYVAGTRKDDTYAMHRLVQTIIRTETDQSGRSNAVISRLMPFLCAQLVGGAEPGQQDADKAMRVQKYLPHLLQALPHLDAPDFRGTEAGDLLDQVAKLVVLSLKEQTIAEDEDSPIPEHLPRLLGCFYEVDPLAKPLSLVLKRTANQPEAWVTFRDACLREDNYVLRFALSTALADAIEKSRYSLKEAATLIERPQSLNHFELGGYTLKSYYSKHPSEEPDPKLLRLLAEHPCYPGRSILGDLMLNLAYQAKTPSKLLPPAEGQNHRFWTSVWDFITYDVDAIVAAEYANSGAKPSSSVRNQVDEEFAYRQSLETQREELRRNLRSTPKLQRLVKDYFHIGSDPRRMADLDDTFAALLHTDLLPKVVHFFFGHPLWSVAEAAANVVARLYCSAVEAEEASARDAYHATITRLLDCNLPWRVRFGALEAAFQIRLHETPKMKTFFHGVRTFHNDPNSKIRGLCAENFVSVLLNASNKRRLELEAEFGGEMRFWLRDEDCWVLEHVHRYFHTLAQRDQINNRSGATLAADISRLCDGLDAWWLTDRESFLTHIEQCKTRAAWS